MVPFSLISPFCCARGVPSITLHRWSQEEMDGLFEVVETRSQPLYHHGNGPYNDVNIPGCWFFKLPHKASWVLLGLFLGLFPAALRPTSPGPATQLCHLSPQCCRTPGTPVILSHGIGWWKGISSWGGRVHRALLMSSGGVLNPGTSFATKGRE